MDDYSIYLYFCFLAMFILFFCHIVHAVVEQRQTFWQIAQNNSYSLIKEQDHNQLEQENLHIFPLLGKDEQVIRNSHDDSTAKDLLPMRKVVQFAHQGKASLPYGT